MMSTVLNVTGDIILNLNSLTDPDHVEGMVLRYEMVIRVWNSELYVNWNANSGGEMEASVI